MFHKLLCQHGRYHGCNWNKRRKLFLHSGRFAFDIAQDYNRSKKRDLFLYMFQSVSSQPGRQQDWNRNEKCLTTLFQSVSGLHGRYKCWNRNESVLLLCSSQFQASMAGSEAETGMKSVFLLCSSQFQAGSSKAETGMKSVLLLCSNQLWET